MDKQKALTLLGGTVATAAEAIGVSYQAIDKWPDVLPPRIADRVLAALARKHLPPELIGAAANGAGADDALKLHALLTEVSAASPASAEEVSHAG